MQRSTACDGEDRSLRNVEIGSSVDKYPLSLTHTNTHTIFVKNKVGEKLVAGFDDVAQMALPFLLPFLGESGNRNGWSPK